MQKCASGDQSLELLYDGDNLDMDLLEIHQATIRNKTATTELTGELLYLGQTLSKSGSKAASAIIRRISEKVKPVRPFTLCRRSGSTGLDLSVAQIIEYYGARWQIESGFKELKQDIGSQKSQCRNAQAVTNHLYTEVS
jgi:IS4 transposase